MKIPAVVVVLMAPVMGLAGALLVRATERPHVRPAEPTGWEELAELEVSCKAQGGIWRWGLKRDELRFYAACLPESWP